MEHTQGMEFTQLMECKLGNVMCTGDGLKNDEGITLYTGPCNTGDEIIQGNRI
jgi:hypothetical protein